MLRVYWRRKWLWGRNNISWWWRYKLKLRRWRKKGWKGKRKNMNKLYKITRWRNFAILKQLTMRKKPWKNKWENTKLNQCNRWVHLRNNIKMDRNNFKSKLLTLRRKRIIGWRRYRWSLRKWLLKSWSKRKKLWGIMLKL